jgi:hypothetical protein
MDYSYLRCLQENCHESRVDGVGYSQKSFHTIYVVAVLRVMPTDLYRHILCFFIIFAQDLK